MNGSTKLDVHSTVQQQRPTPPSLVVSATAQRPPPLRLQSSVGVLVGNNRCALFAADCSTRHCCPPRLNRHGDLIWHGRSNRLPFPIYCPIYCPLYGPMHRHPTVLWQAIMAISSTAATQQCPCRPQFDVSHASVWRMT
jgi:hypothetical protein